MVSVVIPVYNVEKYLKECLDSVLAQTFKDLQVILVDDGSTDQSGKICDEYAAKDDRVTVIHQSNKGAAEAKNTALEQIKGEYFVFVDSDDYLENNMIETLLTAAKKAQADIVECGFIDEYKQKSQVHELTSENKEYTMKSYMKYYIENWNASLLWNKIFKTDVLKDIRFRHERRCIDDEFFTYKLVLKSEKIVVIPGAYYHYRKRKSGAVGNEKNQAQITLDVIEMMRERYDTIAKHDAELGKIYLYHMDDFCLYMLNEYKIDNLRIKAIKKLIKDCLGDTIKNKYGAVLNLNLIKTLLMPASYLMKKNHYQGKKEEDLTIYFE